MPTDQNRGLKPCQVLHNRSIQIYQQNEPNILCTGSQIQMRKGKAESIMSIP